MCDLTEKTNKQKKCCIRKFIDVYHVLQRYFRNFTITYLLNRLSKNNILKF